MPSKLPEVGSECYSVYLDDTTGVHHVTPRKAYLRTWKRKARNTPPTKYHWDSSVAQPRIVRDVVRQIQFGIFGKRKARNTPPMKYLWDSSVAQPRPIREIVRQIQFGMFGQENEVDEFGPAHDEAAENQISLASSSMSTSLDDDSNGTISALAGSDKSRRPSTGSQGSEISTSTVPTSPASSTSLTLPFDKSTLIDLPKFSIAPGKASHVIEALTLERPKHNEPEKIDDLDTTAVRRLSRDLSISYRQLKQWGVLQDLESPCLEDDPPRSGLTMTNDGQIIVAKDASNEAQSSLTSPQPVVNTPPFAPECTGPQSLNGTTMSVPLRLGSSIPVDAINAINTEFYRLWNEGISGRCWVPGQDEDEVQNLAVVNIVPLFGALPADILVVVNDFNKIVANLWAEGHPKRLLVQGSDDHHLINELAARNLEWSYFGSFLKNNAGRTTANELTTQHRKTLEEAPSSFEWYLQNLGGDGQYRKHRSVEVTNVDENNRSKHDSCEDTSFHHLNFNNDRVSERNYTPAEVSFWAASTTITKRLMPCAEQCHVHRVKVITSQAFKRVDPVMYTGTNIEALRSLTGSAMRDAATSEVEVVYEAFGTWTQDNYTMEDLEPRVVSADHGDYYEHSESGLYNYPQRPYYINDEHAEHSLCNVNDPQSSNPSMSRVRSGYEQKFSNLGPDRGVKSPADDDDDDENVSEAETDIEDELCFEREPIHHQSTRQIDETSIVGESSEDTPEEAILLGSDVSAGDSQNQSVWNEFMHTEAQHRLAYWSSSPGRVMRGECDHSYIEDPETEEMERHPNLDWESLDMIADSAEQLNLAPRERDPGYPGYVFTLLGPGTLAQKLISGHRITTADVDSESDPIESSHSRNSSISSTNSSSEAGSAHTRSSSVSSISDLSFEDDKEQMEVEEVEESVSGEEDTLEPLSKDTLALVLLHFLEHFASEKTGIA